jgi:two-component system, OmpR family, phosphate regulon sensor histidine kinase PhoR
MSEPRSIPVHLEVTSVPGLLVAALRPLRDQARRARIELHLAALGEVPEIPVDREKIAWAVTALVGNALRYEATDDAGGSIIVHVTYDEKTAMLGVAVQDDGPGIPDDKLPFLFERRRGAVVADGLALSLVRQIVAAHGGRIEVESRREADDHGTSITLMLPAG